MSYLDGLDDDAILEMARHDYQSALESRRDVQERKLRDYRLYRRFNEYVSGGGIREGDRGEHGWSKMTVPLVFWVVETLLSRMGVDPPKVTVSARTPEAGPFAQAAQLRVDRHLKYSWAEDKAIRAIKQFLILGDAPMKTPWDFALGGPGMQNIPWFDWFVSSEAMVWYEAEVLFHRTWHTKRSLQELARRDRERDEPVYKADCLEELAEMASNRDAQDTSWSPRREASGFSTESWYDTAEQVCMVECWYMDGTRVVIGGDGEDPFKLVRVVREPSFVDPKGIPFRPFTVLQNTPDLFTPYGISDAEMLEDHQSEASTMRRQAMDQATGNLNAPIAYDETRINAEDVQEGFKGPNGLIPTHGANPNEVIARFPPGQLSSDHERMYEQVRSEAQMIPGISDIASGQMQYGSDNSTATGMSIIASESNMRFRMKLKLSAVGWKRFACNWHNLDRLMGSPILGLPVGANFQLEPGQMGVTMSGAGGYAEVNSAAYMGGAEYDIEVDAGAMAPPGQSEQVSKVRSLAMDLSGNPMLAGLTNWQAVGEALVEAAGYDAQRFLMQQPPMQPGLAPPGLPPGPGEPLPEGPPMMPAAPAPMPMPAPEGMFPGAQAGRMPEPVTPVVNVQIDNGKARRIVFERDGMGNLVGASTEDDE
jgi:hypothetical protein